MAEAEAEAEDLGKRSYWSRWRKQDFFPEPSFRSCSHYAAAVSSTLPRLRDRVFHRSPDADELDLLRLRSENNLRRCLTWWDLAWLGFGAVVGSGIFAVTGQEAKFHSGPAIVLSYAAAGFSALLSVFCYTEFAVDVPSAGGSFSYLRVELGDLFAFIGAANILFEAIVGAAGLARSWTSYLATLLNREPDSLRIHVPSLPEGFNLLDPIAVLVLAASSTVAMLGTRGTSTLNWITSLVTVAVIALVVVVGAIHAKPANMSPFMPFGVQGVLRAAAVVYWSYTGFDMMATMAEETRNPAKDIPLGLLGSMSGITVVYCVMAAVISMVQRYSDMDPKAVFSTAFDGVGVKWAKYVVALGALKGMTTGLLVGSLGQARYTTHIARAHMIPPFFALVHPKTQTPVYATLLATVPAACIGLFSSLDALLSMSSISTLFIFTLVALALLVRRYTPKPGEADRAHSSKFAAFLALILGSSVGVAACRGCGRGGWKGYAIGGGLWVAATLGMQLFVPQKRAPKVWGVPCVPWLPSSSVATNLILVASLERRAFVRFGVCTVGMLLYYLLFALHATYDAAHHKARPTDDGKTERPAADLP